MAVTINARGTSNPNFKIGKQGITIYQGTTDPSASNALVDGDVWINQSTGAIKVHGTNQWNNVTFDNIRLIGNTISSTTGDLILSAPSGNVSFGGATILTGNNTTDDVDEGTTNLYHTTARARASIVTPTNTASGQSTLTYNPLTGVFNLASPTTITLGTMTTGNYVGTISAGTGISSFVGTGEGSSPTIGVDSTVIRDFGIQSIAGVKTFTENTVNISGASPRVQLTETDATNKNWFMVSDNGNFSIREDTAATLRLSINAGGAVVIGGTVTAASFNGTGAGMTSLDASNISSGTLSNARLPSAISVTSLAGTGTNITAINATNIISGTLNNARLPSAISVTSLAGTGANITTINASNISSGTLSNARLPSAISVTSLTGNGAGLTNLNATNIATGTLNNARLPSAISVTSLEGTGANITTLNASNISSGTLNNARLPGVISVTSLAGNGANITNLNASNIATGTINNARLPADITMNSLSIGGVSLVDSARNITGNRIFGTGLSTAYGTTSGINTGAFSATMGTVASATWLLSGHSGGIHRGGIQMLDSNGTTRFYAGGNYLQLNSSDGQLILTGALNMNGQNINSANTLNVTSTNPLISIQDTDGSGNTQSGYIALKNSANSVTGSIGFLATNNTDLTVSNTLGYAVLDGASGAIIKDSSVAIASFTDTTGLQLQRNIQINGDAPSIAFSETDQATTQDYSRILQSSGLLYYQNELKTHVFGGQNNVPEILRVNDTLTTINAPLRVTDSVTIEGNLTVNGTTTTINTQTLNISDNIIVLNNDVTGVPTENAGIEVERGTGANVSIRWNESTDNWEYTNNGSTYVQFATGNASTLDSLDSTQFLRSDQTDSTSGSLTIGGNANVNGTLYTSKINTGNATEVVINVGESITYATGQAAERLYVNAENGIEINASPDNWGSGWAGRVTSVINENGITWNGNTVWHQANDGPGSGLNADLLDDLYSTQFLRSDATDVKTAGTLTFNDGLALQLGTSADLRLRHDGTNSLIDNYSGNLYMRNFNPGGETFIQSSNDAGTTHTTIESIGAASTYVRLRYDNVVKLETTNTGIAVVGLVNATSLSGTGTGITALNASNISSGTLNNARLPAAISVTSLAGNGAGITSLNASNITTGTIADARLPTTITSNVTGNAATVTNGVYTNTAQTITGAKSFTSATTAFNGITAIGTGNDYNDTAIESRGNGATDTVFPGYGFHQPGLYAGSIQMRSGGNLSVYQQGGVALGTVTASTFVGSGANLTSLNASNISSGTIADARLPNTITSDITGNAATATTLQTARNIAVSGAVTGSASFNGSGNITIATTATSDPTLTLAGDATGAATFTNLGNTTLTVTVADNSHNHSASNITTGTLADARLPTTITSSITGNAATATVLTGSIADNTSRDIVSYNVGSDGFGIQIGSNATDAGYVDIFTKDNGNEPIFVSQYAVGTLNRRVTLLDGAGNSSFPGNVTGNLFSGSGASLTSLNASNITTGTIADARLPATIASNITGNAATATTLQTARNIAVSGAVTGSASFNGSGNITIATTATADPTLILAGDATGTATFTNLGNATLTVTVVDGSHSHDASNITTGTIADARLPTTITSSITGNAATATTASNLSISTATAYTAHHLLFTSTTGAGNKTVYQDADSSLTWSPGANSLAAPYMAATTSFSSPIINATSDERVKENIRDYANANAKSIRAVNFEWKDKSISESTFAGYIAQEIDSVLPDAVDKSNDEKWTVNYDMVHTAKIAELEKTVEEQSTKITDLETKLAAVIAMVEKLAENK